MVITACLDSTIRLVRQDPDPQGSLQLGDRQQIAPTRACQHVSDRLPIDAARAGQTVGAEPLFVHRLAEAAGEFLRDLRTVVLSPGVASQPRVGPLPVDDEVTWPPRPGIVTGHLIHLASLDGQVIFVATVRGCYLGSDA
jgi:hypothetical protein